MLMEGRGWVLAGVSTAYVRICRVGARLRYRGLGKVVGYAVLKAGVGAGQLVWQPCSLCWLKSLVLGQGVVEGAGKSSIQASELHQPYGCRRYGPRCLHPKLCRVVC